MVSNWAHEFDLHPDLIHLNHAGVGPWPKNTCKAVKQFAKDNLKYSTQHISNWEKVEYQLRCLCQQLINAQSPDDIAFIKNTSEGLSIIAYGIDWHEGDNVIYAKQEFSSNRIIWESLQTRFGVEARCVDLEGASTPEDGLFSQADKKTRLIAVSAVQFATGLRMNLEMISEFCQKQDILLCVDAIQLLGALPFDLNKVPADFVIADGHKWLLSPEGIGLLYCNPMHRSLLKLNQFGWHMLENAHNYEARVWQVANSAKRFECGSLNNLGIHAMHASLDLILKIGLETIYKYISRNISYIYELARKLDLIIISNMELERRSGIITVKSSNTDNKQLYKSLLKENVLCAFRNGGIRLSPHFYTGLHDIDNAIDLLTQKIQSTR